MANRVIQYLPCHSILVCQGAHQPPLSAYKFTDCILHRPIIRRDLIILIN